MTWECIYCMSYWYEVPSVPQWLLYMNSELIAFYPQNEKEPCDVVDQIQMLLGFIMKIHRTNFVYEIICVTLGAPVSWSHFNLVTFANVNPIWPRSHEFTSGPIFKSNGLSNLCFLRLATHSKPRAPSALLSQKLQLLNVWYEFFSLLFTFFKFSFYFFYFLRWHTPKKKLRTFHFIIRTEKKPIGK